jgi:hypothetical protein
MKEWGDPGPGGGWRFWIEACLIGGLLLLAMVSAVWDWLT